MASPFSRNGLSREVTPSSSSSQSATMEQTTSSGASMDASSQSQDDMDKFLKRMDMEKTMHALQSRLELASVKATNGWTDMTIGEIETQLPPTPSRKRASISVVTERTVPTSPQVPYEAPSPTRPWQLIDVLWQPLPPPSHSRHPTSPTSPKKRTRIDSHYAHPGTNGHLPGHRRASSSLGSSTYLYTDPYPSSPLREIREGEKKQRSQSHSLQRRPETTTQDVDAAKALTSMLGSGSSPWDSISRGSPLQAPLLPSHATTSLPLPPSFESHSSRPRSYSVDISPEYLSPRPSSSRPPDLRTPSSHTRSRIISDSTEEVERGEEDKTAAELMMYLAHSPSPNKRFNPYSSTRMAGGAARVLFAEPGDTSGGAKVAQHSNLAMAPPITAETGERMKEGGRVAVDRDR